MIANDWPAIQAARKIAMADESADERRVFYRFIGIGATLCVLALIGILAGIAHFDKDEALRVEYLKAQYTIRQQEELIKLGQKFDSMSVRVASIPPSDFSYDLVMVPKVRR